MLPDQAAVDVNALMTALAQASAALIAIVGGLLVSRYVTLHAEQQGAQRRLDDIDRRLTASKEDRIQAIRDLDVHLVDDLLEDERAYEEILRHSTEATVQDVLDALDHDGSKLNQDVLGERLTALQHEIRRASTSMFGLVPQATQHDSWSKFRRKHEIEVGHKGAWEWVYDRICAEKTEAAHEEAVRAALPAHGRQSRQRILRQISAAAQVQIPQYRFPSTYDRTRKERLLARRNEADAEVRALSHERELVQETYDATKQPEGFNLALQVLSLLAVLGMGLPVAVMAIPLTGLPTWSRALVVLGVALGVGMLLRYLFVYAAYLKEGGQSALPKNLLGLIPWPWRPRRGDRESGNPAPQRRAAGPGGHTIGHTNDHKD
ncbi:hypothetical protein ABTX24_18675 [Nocardioides sp. NPDC127514]|uniref:hypothetical protein n=1 Tax=unclassified Nocardioides TaxID=2615069 RepID=UPI003322FC36